MATTSAASATSGSSATTSSSSANTDRMQSLGVQDFTKMLVAELTNQDPMEPMKNSDMLQQISQIRAISSSDQLSTTLQSVLLGQNVATAGNLIGRSVTGLDGNGARVTGTVNSVSIANGAATLNVGSSTLSLTNVTQISPAGTSG
ncbi:MAG: flagellar hook capping FlgD N-terminal domain-containing protein [Planctomycetota bacterium]